MTLLIDRRQELQGKPGLHAFIVGVSAYAFLPGAGEAGTHYSMGLHRLSSTASSAFKVFCWLKQHQDTLFVPLATLRLLLSPTSEEIASQPELDCLADAATLDNFLREAKYWRDDAANDPQNVTFFYFAGHGAQQTKDDAVILFEDFGDGIGGPLHRAVDVGNIHKGMAASKAFPNIAQTQFYFIDACREFLTSFRNHEPNQASQVFEVQLPNEEDQRNAPIFFASVPGSKAYALSGQQTLFSQALLNCLNNDAGDFKEIDGQDRWFVSVHSLSEALSKLLIGDDLPSTPDQEIVVGGLVRDTIITYLDQAPLVKVSLEVDPPSAVGLTRLEILNDEGAPGPSLPFPLQPHPYDCVWPAGFYTIRAVITPPDPRYADVPGHARAVMPPRYPKKLRVIR